ncbi:hypothetical protein [Saccharopolyspora rhizosphaerae]|uniref:hypothetical protein n=1 Tax=Saccharopolyspora rhizosphaerae TaxID=2492662 RepID=UPI001F16C164|nr:hypothetical protein [Saccharopolyspora rhizosphaerae]
MTASVVSGTISDTEPTNVVLPAPKPPATTIFAEVVVGDLREDSGRACVSGFMSAHFSHQVKAGICA